MVVIVVLSISVLLQFAAVIAVLRLIRTVGGRAVWLSLSAAILLMSIRRVVSLSKAIDDYPNPSNSLDAELIALVISALILVAVTLIRPLIESIRRTEKKFTEQIERDQVILHTSPDGFLATDKQGLIQETNTSFCNMTGQDEAQLLGRNINEFIVFPAPDNSQQDWLTSLPEQDELRFEAMLGNEEHEHIDVAVTAKYVEHDDDSFVYVFVRDITLSKKAKLELSEQKQRAQVTLASIGDGVITTDIHGHIQFMNPMAETLVGHMNREAEGELLTNIVKLVDDEFPLDVIDPVAECLRENKSYLLSDKTLLGTRGNTYFVEVVVSPLCSDEGQVIGAVLVIHNVTELKSLADSLSFQASHDVLTGLVNRREFENRLESALVSARRDNVEHAMCYMDLDQFKLVNDTCGHIAGDELLKQLTQLLHGVVRESDTLARLGGDEFGILLESCSLKQARRVVDSIFETISEYRFQWDNRVFEIGLSIGLVPITADSGNLTDILSSADSACYVAKENGRNCVHVFEPNDAALLQRRGQMEWVQRIQQALEENRFVLYGQSIRPLSKGITESHVEILIRMLDEQGELISPNEFLPVAERYHMMPGIDRWVVNRVFDCINRKYDCDIDTMELVTINLSGQSISDETFLSYVLDLFEQYQVAGEKICFEVTETAVISNITHARNFISVLRHRGCKFALDDFGSGLSSFQYLKDLEVDYLKIDGSFIRSMRYNDNNFNMVVSINHIGHIMGLQTIAEYVENEATITLLEEVGVNFIQGFVVDKPHPVFEQEKQIA